MVLKTLLFCKFFTRNNKRCLVLLFSLGGIISFFLIGCFILSFYLIYKRKRRQRNIRIDELRKFYDDFISLKIFNDPVQYYGIFESYYNTLDNNTMNFFNTLDHENQELFMNSFIKKDKAFSYKKLSNKHIYLNMNTQDIIIVQ